MHFIEQTVGPNIGQLVVYSTKQLPRRAQNRSTSQAPAVGGPHRRTGPGDDTARVHIGITRKSTHHTTISVTSSNRYKFQKIVQHVYYFILYPTVSTFFLLVFIPAWMNPKQIGHDSRRTSLTGLRLPMQSWRIICFVHLGVSQVRPQAVEGNLDLLWSVQMFSTWNVLFSHAQKSAS